MPITHQFVELTHEELQLMVQNLDSKDVVSNPLERFIMYSSIILQRKAAQSILNTFKLKAINLFISAAKLLEN